MAESLCLARRNGQPYPSVVGSFYHRNTQKFSVCLRVVLGLNDCPPRETQQVVALGDQNLFAFGESRHDFSVGGTIDTHLDRHTLPVAFAQHSYV